MAKINGQIIELPYIVSLESFFKYVALDFNSLPKFIKWMPKKPTSLKDLLISSNSYEVTDLLTVLINSKSFEFDSKLYEKIDADLDECETLFIVFHSNREDPGFKIMIKSKNFFKKIDVEEVLKRGDFIREKHKNEREFLRQQVEQFMLEESEFKSYQSGSYTDVEPLKIRYTLKLGRQDLTLDELFNAFIPDETVPLIMSENFIKTLRGFKIFDRDYLSEAVLIKVNSEKLFLKSLKDPYKKYSDAAFAIKNEILYATFDLPVGKRYISQQEFTARALSALKLDLPKPEYVDVGYVAVFTLLKQTLNISVLADMVLTHPLISQIVCIDESVRSHKKKPTAYLHFPDTDQTANVQEKTVERFNQYPNMNEGDSILMVRVKTIDRKQALKIRETIAKIITIYNMYKEKVIFFYKEYIPFFLKTNPQKRPVKIKKIALKDVAPDIFIPTYSRQCLNIPETIDSIEDLEDVPFMKFPVYGESQPRFYICPYKTHPYPGLRINNLSNKDKFPFIPCCYSKDQSKRKNSKWQMYFNKIKIEKEQSEDYNSYYMEALPSSLADFFKSLTDLKFVRITGSYLEESAIVACKWAYKEEMSPKEATALKKSWANDELNAIVCAQELYAQTEERNFSKLSQHFVKDETLILEHYFRLLEEYFEVYIYCFDQKGPVSWPSLGPHYRFRPKNRQIILIYKFNTPKGIQYDLIASVNESIQKGPVKSGVTSFSPLDVLIKRLEEFINETTKIYVSGKTISPLFIKSLPVRSQKLDFYGKTRVLILDDFAIETTPLPPYKVPIYTDEIPKTGTMDNIKRVLGNRFNIIYRDDVKVIGILDECCQCSIPLVESTKAVYFLKDFTVAEKTARLLKEYVKRLFINTYDDLNRMTKTDFVNFAKNKLTVDPLHIYETPFKSKFDQNNFFRGDRLIVPDQETVRRLMYFIFLEYSYDPLSFKKYKSITSIPNFFLTPADFKSADYYFIIPTKAKNYFTEYEIFDVILPGDRLKPYLFAYEDETYLVQNCKNFETASYIVFTWIKEGYNPGIRSDVNVSFKAKIVLWSKNKPLTSLDEADLEKSAVLIHKDYDGLEYAALLQL